MSYIEAGLRLSGGVSRQKTASDRFSFGPALGAPPADKQVFIQANADTRSPLTLSRFSVTHSAALLELTDSGFGVLSAFRPSGALVLGGSALSGTEMLRCLGTARVEGALTQLTGAVTLTANAASSFTTSAGGLTLTGAAASFWSTTAGALTITSAAATTWSTAAGILSLSGQAGMSFQVNGTPVASMDAAGTEFIIAANKNLSASAGTGALSFGSMTGNWAMPTGSGSWAGAAGKTLSLVANTAAITITAAAASTWSTSAGALTLTSAAAATWSTAAGALALSGAGGLLLSSGGALVASLDAGGTELVVAANKNLAGSAGTGALSFGSMTGNTALPTGNLSWAGAAAKTLSLTGQSTATITAGGAMLISTSSGAITITGQATSIWSVTDAAADLTIDAGRDVFVGPTNADSVNIGRAGINTNIAGTCNAGTLVCSTDLAIPEFARQTSTITLVDTNLATVATSLSLTLAVGNYQVHALLVWTSGAASTDGFRTDFDFTGTTNTSTRRATRTWNVTNNTFIDVQTQTNLTTDVTITGEASDTFISYVDVYVEVLTAGTLNLRAAKSADAAADTTLLISSYVWAVRMAS